MHRSFSSRGLADHLDAQWSKALRDLWVDRMRTALVVLSIAIGVFCVGMVVGARSTILQALSNEYAATRPANVSLTTDPFSGSLLRSVRLISGVKDVDARFEVTTRIETHDGRWKGLLLFAIPDFRHMRLNRVFPQQGAWPPPPDGMLLERASVAPLGLRIGGRLPLETPTGRRWQLTLAGTAHDVNEPASAVSGIYYGYVTFSTLAALGQGHSFNRLLLTLTGDQHDTRRVWAVANAARALLERTGRKVYSTVVPKPGRLWLYDAVQSMLLLLTILAVSSLAMSSFLVINTVAGEINRQVAHVGIMKTIGARPRQVAGIYVAKVAVLSLLALCVGIPLGIIGALGLIRYTTNFLDFDAPALGISPAVFGLEIGAGIGLPLLAALVPILHGSHITVHDAVARYGTEGGGVSRAGQSLDHLPFLPDAVVLGIANTFRRKGRLLMTLVAMILGGAVFISVVSVRASLLRTLDDIFGYRNFDVQIDFPRSYPGAAVEQVARRVPGVARAEGWAVAAAQRSHVSGLAAETISLVAPPADSTLIKPVVLHGRWLDRGDGRSIVVNSDLVADQPELHVGSRVSYSIYGHPVTCTVVGVVRGVQHGPIAYMTYGALGAIAEVGGLIDRLVVVGDAHDAASQSAISRRLEVSLARAGFEVDAVETTDDQRAILGASFDVIVEFLLIMALLLATVAGLGLTGSMAIGVLERTREIGVMRAVGASNHDLFEVIAVEGGVIAVLSWATAALIAIPLSRALSAAVGNLFIHAPLAYTFSAGGAFTWLGGALTIAVTASAVPTWSACRLTVRDILAYE